MRTLGIDLSSQPAKTAACVIDWDDGGATISDLRLKLTDGDILNLASQLELGTSDDGGGGAIGIDAPFGWPLPFVELISRSPTAGEPIQPWSPKWSMELRYRLTDLRVIEDLGLFPLAVAADKIALPALRCAGLLAALGVVDRSGVDGVFEVYPAAALKAWSLPFKGYKPGGVNPARATANLASLFALVREACSWLSIPPEAEGLFTTSDHVFDALIASLVARAAARRRTGRPRDPNEEVRARVEGWIAVPTTDCRIEDLWPSAMSNGAARDS